jgi:hypothetical protein
MRLRPLRNSVIFALRELPLLAMFLSPNSALKGPEETIYPGKSLQKDEIRLITLQPGRWTDPIVCELTNVPLDASRYRALSYVWGSQKVIRTIRLNGHNYSVTVNLKSALRHLREKYKERIVLWVDALYVFLQRSSTKQI